MGDAIVHKARRARIIEAMVLEVHERGYPGTTLTAVCARARVARSTFYEAFDDLEACFLGVIDDGYLRTSTLITQAFEREGCWREGVRSALASLLRFFDSEPYLARVWLVETLAAGAWALERRERHLAALTRMIVEHWTAGESVKLSALAATGVMESILGVIRAHLLTKADEPLVALLGPLMGLVTTPYLGARAATQEIERGDELARGALLNQSAARTPRTRPDQGESTSIPSLLADPRAHRARECLHQLSRRPGASNRQVGNAVGILRDTHISTLLARLHELGLLTKHPGRPGTANAWSLSPYGMQVLKALQPDPGTRVHATQGSFTKARPRSHNPSNSSSQDAPV
jgi:AcrR family transcriptional regulator